MLRRTRFSLSISEPRPKPTKKEWIYQWSLIPDDFSAEDTDETDEYVQEWNFPYPGQKELLVIDPNGLVSTSMPPALRDKFQKGRLTYLKQGNFFVQVTKSMVLASVKK